MGSTGEQALMDAGTGTGRLLSTVAAASPLDAPCCLQGYRRATMPKAAADPIATSSSGPARRRRWRLAVPC